ncbi:hypothetical protein [Nitratifractor salsuginis]|uniref:Uncharacterized protein n=1 Tax=Nitratifractor salsuginis (strain DSM 16511 / JCM 12458 / E9I37-1) TaxID=749222 RepID=E6WYU6_NITSE|nr:hypothetical protein [Nitratifractor salsuginis]ADV46532.1 hypothetical protein Nitsa_1280 [Nitratifractor salsuginis DSM 16511]
MQIEFIEEKFNEIFAELEKEVMEILQDQSLDKKNTNLRMKPLSSTKQILQNALESIRLVDRLNREGREEGKEG